MYNKALENPDSDSFETYDGEEEEEDFDATEVLKS